MMAIVCSPAARNAQGSMGSGTAVLALLCVCCCAGTALLALLCVCCCAGTAVRVLLCWHCCAGAAVLALLYWGCRLALLFWHCCAGAAVLALCCAVPVVSYASPVFRRYHGANGNGLQHARAAGLCCKRQSIDTSAQNISSTKAASRGLRDNTGAVDAATAATLPRNSHMFCVLSPAQPQQLEGLATALQVQSS
jgi:hypothetical protein